MTTSIVARRFFISGGVQGVGYRFFAQRSATTLGVRGYVKNLFDGRVEVYAIAPDEILIVLREQLKRGPRSASVEEVAESEAELLAEFSGEFSIEHET